MSIFDELLICIDDQEELSTPSIELLLSKYSHQTVSSALGRLVGRGWVLKKLTRVDESYRLTPSGTDYLNHILSAIHQAEQPWDGTWFCLVASIPENQRRERDMLRYQLHSYGFGKVIDGLWIAPRERFDILAQLNQKIHSGQYLLSFQTQPLGQASNQMLIKRAWDWEKSAQKFAEFVAWAELTQRQVATQNISSTDALNRRLAAKTLVFAYGSILSSDANLPIALVPRDPLRTKAYELYSVIRPYCYQ